MKKMNLILVLLIGCIFTSYSQLGVRFGGNFSKFANTDDVEYDTKTGLIIGPFFRANVFGNIALQVEANFSQYGATIAQNSNGSEYRVNYLQIPILLKYGFGDSEKTSFFLQGGPYFGNGLGKVSLKDCATGDCETTKQSFKDANIKNGDSGIILGFGVNITKNLFADFRYAFGFTNVSKIPDDISKKKNRAFNIGVGYAF